MQTGQPPELTPEERRELLPILAAAGIVQPTEEQWQAAWRVAHALRLLALLESRRAGVKMH